MRWPQPAVHYALSQNLCGPICLRKRFLLSASRSPDPLGEYFCEKMLGYMRTYFAKRPERTGPFLRNGLKLRVLAPGTASLP
jgi:hypothetical protein